MGRPTIKGADRALHGELGPLALIYPNPLPYYFVAMVSCLTAGVAAILVQFHIDYFRSIGWYNAALGVLFVLLQFAVFHGESKWHCENVRQKYGCTLPKKSNWKKTVTVSNVLVILISLKH